jgi:hypothetical protein
MSKFKTGEAVVNYLTNLIFKKEIQKKKGIPTLLPENKVNAEKKARFIYESIKKRGNIDADKLTTSELEYLAESAVNPIKTAEKTVVKSADIVPFPFKRSFAEELAAASKKGDFNRMSGIMKVDPKFKEVIKAYKKSKADEEAYEKMVGPKKLIPDRDVIPYQSPEVQKLSSAEKQKYLITNDKQTAEIMKKGYTFDDIIYAQDNYGMRADEIVEAAKSGEKFPFADGGRIGYAEGNGVYDEDVAKKKFGERVKKLMDEGYDFGEAVKEAMKEEGFADGGVAGLLGERQNFAMGRRAFMKLLGGVGAGIGALKTGAFKLLGKETAPVAKEVVKDVATGSGTPPPYFFKLVEKIKTLGDDTLPTKDKVIAKKYKDYVMEEDFSGNIEITRKGDMDVPGYEEVYMSYRVDEVPIKKGKKKSTKVEEYEEYTARPDQDGKMKDVEEGVPDDVVEDGTMFEDNITDFGKKITKTKKASGGLAYMVGE